MKLTAHPRLYINQDNIKRLKHEPKLPELKEARKQVARSADEFAKSPDFEWSMLGHNVHLIRARMMQLRVVTLLSQWSMTNSEKYRQAAIDHLVTMGNWEYWSWITWRKRNPDPMAIYDLSYGENSATLAIGYTWLHDTLTDGEKAQLQNFARIRSLKPYLKFTTQKQPASWFGRPDSNWNTVCSGGAGMLALAMHEDLDEARKALPLAEKSIKPFMDELKRTNGGWVEGLGYWNYGMRYAFMYLLSHERATGKKHPLLHNAATRKTLEWPLMMTPHGQPAAFGDGNHWTPLPFHFAAAEATGQTGLIPTLHEQVRDSQTFVGPWPQQAEMLLLHPGKANARRPKVKRNVATLIKGLDWAILADQMPEPKFYTSIRAGAWPVPHAHKDLSSFHVVADGERLVESLNSRAYLDTTFSSRRYELFETSYRSKNVMLIDGVGMADQPAPIAPLNVGRLSGFRVDMSNSMGKDRESNVCKFYGRAFFMLPKAAGLVVVDHLDLNHPCQLESRIYTFANLKLTSKHGARIKGKKAQLQIAQTASVDSQAFFALPPTTLPPVSQAARYQGYSVDEMQPKLLRYCSLDFVSAATFVSVIARGRHRPTVSVDTSGKGVAIDIEGKDADGGAFKQSIALTNRLRAKK